MQALFVWGLPGKAVTSVATLEFHLEFLISEKISKKDFRRKKSDFVSLKLILSWVLNFSNLQLKCYLTRQSFFGTLFEEHHFYSDLWKFHQHSPLN